MSCFERFRQRIDEALKEKNIYEALQIYRTVRNRTKTNEQVAECLNLLFKGIEIFAQEKEDTAVLDLSEVYADVLVSLKVQPCAEIYCQIKEILKVLPTTLSKDTENAAATTDIRSKFTNDIFKWSREVSSHPFRKIRGDPALHKIFANIHWSQGAHNIARLHFLLANDPEEFSKFLIEYTTVHDVTEDDESDNYGAQAVFQLLAYKKLKVAQAFFLIYCRDHPKIRQTFPFKSSVLLNFVYLLLTTLQNKDFNNFVYLLEKGLRYRSYLDKIAQLFFNAPAKQQSGGMFGDLLKHLMPSSKEGHKEDYSPDEDMPPTVAQLGETAWGDNARTFDDLNHAADQVNPQGLTKEPDMFEDAHEEPKAATGPVEMDLD